MALRLTHAFMQCICCKNILCLWHVTVIKWFSRRDSFESGERTPALFYCVVVLQTRTEKGPERLIITSIPDQASPWIGRKNTTKLTPTSLEQISFHILWAYFIACSLSSTSYEESLVKLQNFLCGSITCLRSLTACSFAGCEFVESLQSYGKPPLYMSILHTRSHFFFPGHWRMTARKVDTCQNLDVFAFPSFVMDSKLNPQTGHRVMHGCLFLQETINATTKCIVTLQRIAR